TQPVHCERDSSAINGKLSGTLSRSCAQRSIQVLLQPTSMGMIGVLEITLIVPTLRVGMPSRTLRVRS
ncbi:hypothetical protein, partial [Pseudomonas viridiflava]|uniref:hypothetical protein n=1 Tax=Pseudomonas viridiflava TaxID=33069 RepID=UPI001981B125